MPTVGNKDQTIVLSETDGTVQQWIFRRDTDIFYPQQVVRRNHTWKLRGGMHVCWPWFGTIDPSLPQHGILRGRMADEITENGVVFRGPGLLGPKYDEECEVRIAVELTRDGFIYILAARLLKPAMRDIYVNPGLHPYFRTPTGKARAGTWGGKEMHFYQRKHGPVSTPVEQGAGITIPGIGKVQMMLGGAWKNATSKRAYFWRDSRNYLCVEPTFGSPNLYGTPSCTLLTDAWFEMYCTFQVTLE